MDTSTFQPTTLCFLRQGNQVLLAMKKRGFGQGKWNGLGGKVQPSEDIVAGAIRETKEEIGVTPHNLEKIAELFFEFPPEKKAWNQHCHVYISQDWTGEPQESDEMAPRWFSLEEIPFAEMWETDSYWLAQVLNGTSLKGYFTFDADQKLISHSISPCPPFK